MTKMRDLFGFVIDLEKFKYGSGIQLILKRINIDRALIRVNANPGAVANDGNIEINDISRFVPSIDSRNDNINILQKDLSKKININFSYYERKILHQNVSNATKFLIYLGTASKMTKNSI